MSQFSLFFFNLPYPQSLSLKGEWIIYCTAWFCEYLWKWHLVSKWRPSPPSRSLREHDSNWAIMKRFRRSVGKFRVVWGSYKSGLNLAWGRNPVINLLAADTVLLSPCARCKAHLNTVTLPFTCTWLKVLLSQAPLFASQEISSREIKCTLQCMWYALARPLCVAPTGTNLLPIELEFGLLIPAIRTWAKPL